MKNQEAVRIVSTDDGNVTTITKSNGEFITKSFPPLRVVIDALIDSGRFDCDTVCDFVNVIYGVAREYQPDQERHEEIIYWKNIANALKQVDEMGM